VGSTTFYSEEASNGSFQTVPANSRQPGATIVVDNQTIRMKMPSAIPLRAAFLECLGPGVRLIQ
jgi:hypothetical protein